MTSEDVGAQKSTEECVHRWALPAYQNAEGPTIGNCKICGMSRSFSNATLTPMGRRSSS